ncbi:hypothetical protein ADH76_23540 [Enterocloster clostridioformis]|nr:hypothetical protein A4V08_36140 [Lachnoclostridium sp. YL32]NDO31383.1 hypothetical protein [Enterocloster clostridioformis]OXE65237.1 hypothetical protein ADH76_23540 [Enterocloster clostridioformis]
MQVICNQFNVIRFNWTKETLCLFTESGIESGCPWFIVIPFCESSQFKNSVPPAVALIILQIMNTVLDFTSGITAIGIRIED